MQRDGIPTTDDVFAIGEHVCRLLDRGQTVDGIAQSMSEGIDVP